MKLGKIDDKKILEPPRGFSDAAEDVGDSESPVEVTKSTEDQLNTQKPSKSTCQTPECVKLAENIKNFIDDSVSPCDDFYAHACGNYRYNQEEMSQKYMKFEEQSREALKTVTDYLAENNTKAVLPAEVLLQKTYKKCVIRGINDTLDMLSDLEKRIGWPMEENVKMSSFDINLKIANFLMLNADAAGFFYIEGYRKMLDIVPIFCDDFYQPLNTKAVNAVLMQIKDEEKLKKAKNSLKMALEVDEISAKCSKNPLKTSTKTIPANHSDIENFSKIDFGLILQTLAGRNERGVRAGLLKQSLVFNSTEFTDPNSTINRLFEKNPSGVIDYLAIKYIESYALKDLFMDDHKCANTVFNLLPRTALSMYINHFVRKENVEQIPILVDQMKSEFQKILTSNTWISDATRELLEERVTQFHTDIGDQYASGTEDKLLQKLEITEEDTFYTFYTRLNAFTAKNSMEYVLSDLEMSTEVEEMDAKSNYNHRLSAKKLLAPMILEPLFDVDFPLAVQFGKAGALIGHELGHLVHPLDRKLKVDEQWDGGSVQQYQLKEHCVLNMSMRPSKRRQWMGDFFGVKAALGGLKGAAPRGGEKFEGMDEKKLFFYSVAQMKCQKKNRVSQKESLPLNRIISQFAEFSDAFQCPLGSPMNPQKKCAVF